MAKSEQLGKVRIEKTSAADRPDRRSESFGKNPYSRDNVNVAQGPRTGMTGAHDAKRSNFLASKAEREPLAAVIQDAYARRQHEYEDYEYTNGGSIEDVVKPRRFKRDAGSVETAYKPRRK